LLPLGKGKGKKKKGKSKVDPRLVPFSYSCFFLSVLFFPSFLLALFFSCFTFLLFSFNFLL